MIFVNRDFSKREFVWIKILITINVTAIIGDMGLYFEENEAKIILSAYQPYIAIPAIIITRYRNDSFLLMI